MIRVRLSEAISAYERKTGKRLSYADLASLTGVARSTIESIATRAEYNPTLRTIGKLCDALAVTPGELLECGQCRQPTPKKKRGR